MIFKHQDYLTQKEYSADVVVVGTGAGGGAVGAELAQAGFEVLFIEEGGYHPTSSFNAYATESIPRLYREASGTVAFGKPPIPYVEGRCVGGSTVINGGMTWRTPEDVLENWVKITGTTDFSPKAMEPLFERVEKNIHADRQLDLSVGEDNRIMAEGAKKMGWRSEVNRRNQQACVGSNNCIFGCPTGAKQSTLVSYLPKAWEHGASCLTELRIEKLVIKNGKCRGVVGRAYNPRTRKQDIEVRVHAKVVIIACGAVQTPLLLLGHKLGRPSRQLGKNLLLHPNAKVLAVYPREVKAWQGVSQWTQIREFINEGILFAENFVPPSALAAYLPFHGNKIFNLMQDYNRMVVSGVLVEDSTSGEVRRGPWGMAMPRYDITPLDFARFQKGVRLLAEMHFAMGATKVILPFSNFPVATEVDQLRRIDGPTITPEVLELFTVHLMGTARMGTRDSESVLNLAGELWDLPGCYVADASVFPTAIGVNPQVTIMALATRIAQRLIESASALRRVA
jgi:choline dehydrogenase-like flavoprotein